MIFRLFLESVNEDEVQISSWVKNTMKGRVLNKKDGI